MSVLEDTRKCHERATLDPQARNIGRIDTEPGAKTSEFGDCPAARPCSASPLPVPLRD